MERRTQFGGVSIEAVAPDDWNGQRAFVLAHGAGKGMDSPFMCFFHSGIAEMGHLSVKFNFPYMERRRRAPDTQKKLRETYLGVIDQIASEFEPESIIIGGKSMGGRVASYIAEEASLVNGLVYLGYPLHPPGRIDRLRDEHLYGLPLPMLFINGTRDTLAKREILESVVRKIGSRATLKWIDGGDHSFKIRKSDRPGLEQALDCIRLWSGQLVEHN